MSLHPSVRIVAEGTGALLMASPGFFSLPKVDDLVTLSEDGGATTAYKVEKVEYLLDKANHASGPGGTQKYSINGTVNITVSVVP